MTNNFEFTPESVLAAAFGDHDFIGHIGDQEVAIATSAPFQEGEHTLIEVDAVTSPIEDGVTYRYRVVFDRVVTDEELEASRRTASGS
jgi:hypothetical protein